MVYSEFLFIIKNWWNLPQTKISPIQFSSHQFVISPIKWAYILLAIFNSTFWFISTHKSNCLKRFFPLIGSAGPMCPHLIGKKWKRRYVRPSHHNNKFSRTNGQLATQNSLRRCSQSTKCVFLWHSMEMEYSEFCFRQWKTQEMENQLFLTKLGFHQGWFRF